MPPPAPPAPPEPPGLDDIPGFDAPAPPIEGSMLAAEEPAPAIDEPEIDIGEPSVSPEEMVGSPEPPSYEELEAAEGLATESSPFEVEIEDETGQPLESPPPPSWDGVAEACRGLAQARGALLADPSGEVFAVRGDWPEPGPNAIAAKLVSMMNRTLKDAPTRSISAPLMGMHLTAWRVPLDRGLVTAAFIADAPVRAEARPAIDTEIHRASGI
jgi:hypothetical protein